MNSTTKALIPILIALVFMLIITTFLIKMYEPNEKKLYKVTFSTGLVIIDSLRDEENALRNERIEYPKASIISYSEIKNTEKK